MADPIAPLLRLQRLARAFGGVRALDGLDLDIHAGEVVGLIGPNGAGKTTVINLISGLLRPTSGAILLSGERLDGLAADRIAARGVARTFQNIRLFRGLSARENVLVGQHHTRPERLGARLIFAPAAAREARIADERSAQLLAEVGLAGREHVLAGALPYGDQRRLEIARALGTRPRLLLLDEPAAGMPAGETTRLMELIRGLPASGVSVLLIEHNMHLVMGVSDRIAVLNFGRKIAEGAPGVVAADRDVIDAYLGADEGCASAT